MPTLLERAFDGIRQLPEAEQNDLAGLLLTLISQEGDAPTGLLDEDRIAIAAADAEFERGDVLQGEALAAYWKKLLA